MITNTNSGIYRIFVKSKDQEYSYIGVSKNIENRIKIHFSKIKKMMNSPELLQTLKYYNIPIKNAFYWKISTFLLVKNLKFEDIKTEILKIKTFEKIEEIEPLEMDFIKKHNSELLGFNGLFAKYFKYVNAARLGFLDSYGKKTLKNEFDKNNNFKKILLKNPKKALPWVAWQILLFNPEKDKKITETIQIFFCNYCNDAFFSLKKNFKNNNN